MYKLQRKNIYQAYLYISLYIHIPSRGSELSSFQASHPHIHNITPGTPHYSSSSPCSLSSALSLWQLPGPYVRQSARGGRAAGPDGTSSHRLPIRATKVGDQWGKQNNHNHKTTNPEQSHACMYRVSYDVAMGMYVSVGAPAFLWTTETQRDGVFNFDRQTKPREIRLLFQQKVEITQLSVTYRQLLPCGRPP